MVLAVSPLLIKPEGDYESLPGVPGLYNSYYVSQAKPCVAVADAKQACIACRKESPESASSAFSWVQGPVRVPFRSLCTNVGICMAVDVRRSLLNHSRLHQHYACVHTDQLPKFLNLCAHITSAEGFLAQVGCRKIASARYYALLI